MYLYQLCVYTFGILIWIYVPIPVMCVYLWYSYMNLCTYTSYVCIPLVFLYESMYLYQWCVYTFGILIWIYVPIPVMCVYLWYSYMNLCTYTSYVSWYSYMNLCTYTSYVSFNTNLNLYIKNQNLTSPQCIWMVISLVALGLFLSGGKEERLLFIISTNTELFGNVFIFLIRF